MNMRLVKFLSTWSLPILVFSIASSALGGIVTMGILMILSRFLSSSEDLQTLRWEFGLAAALAIVASASSRLFLGMLGRKSLAQVRKALAHQIAHLPFSHIEQLGSARLMSCLTVDISKIADALPNLVRLSANIGFASACLIYLAWLSPTRLASTLAIIFVGMAGYLMLQRQALRYTRASATASDELLYAFRSLIEGSAEIRLSALKRARTLSLLGSNTDQLRHSEKQQSSLLDGGAIGFQLLFFLTLGIVIFATGEDGVNRHVLTSYSIAIIYLMMPLQGVIGRLRDLNTAGVALDNLSKLGLAPSKSTYQGYHTESFTRSCERDSASWKTLRLSAVAHWYETSEARSSFILDRTDLSLVPGEIAFIIGGNGSGKTTLAKILAGLYTPGAGELLLDGQVITDSNIDWYREHCSAVFNDFFLFRFSDWPAQTQSLVEASALLTRLGLKDKVHLTCSDTPFSSLSLSTGERKRLALALTILENRAIMIFDEVAAEQEPDFKNVFYHELLPELREAGKLVIVVSHDDRYFHVADKLICLERGMSVRVQEQHVHLAERLRSA